METIKDLWASLVAYANERSTNPLTSAFFLTWAGWNYKFFVVLFNDETSAEKFAAIDALYPRPDALYGNAFLYPALMTLFYVFAYPYITSWVVTFYRRRQVEIANNLKKVEGERVRTVNEVAQMVRRFEKRIKDAQDEANSALQELADVRNALQAAELELRKNSSFTSVGTGTVSGVGEVRNPAPSQQVMPNNGLQKVYSWVVQGVDGLNSKKSITTNQARILHLAGKGQMRSSSEIAELLELPLEDVNADIRILVQLNALSRSNGVFEVSDWGRTILDVIDPNGEIAALNAGVFRI